MEDLIRKLVLKHIEKTKGSKIISTLKQQEKSIKQVIIAGLIEWPHNIIVQSYT